jgi:hypothetical protein
MTFTTISKRLAATGAATALAAGALVGASTTAAHAAPIENEYFCDGPTTDFPLTLDSDIPALASIPEISAGFDVQAGFLDTLGGVTNTVTVPSAVIDGLAGFGITRVEAPDFAGSFGPVSVGVSGVGADVADAQDNGDGTDSFTANGSNKAFEVPAAGTYDLLGPESITLVGKNDAGDTVLTAICPLADGETNGSYGTVLVNKNDSTTTGKPAKKSFKKGTAAKVKVTVSAANETPGGKVLLKKGTKTLDKGNLNDMGKAVLSTKALKVGKNKLTIVYKGDGYTNPDNGSVVVKVVR